MRRLGFTVVAAGLAAGLLAGCSSGSESAGTAALPLPAQAQSGDGRMSQDSVADDARAESAKRVQPEQPEQPAEQVSVGQPGVSDRKLARRASMTLRVKDVDEAAAAARDIATAADGYTGSERSTAKSARLTLTVPAANLETVLQDLEELGKRTSRGVSVKDVTESVVDVDSRVKSQRRSIARARALLDRAQTISEIVAVEQKLASREAELESLLARQKALAGQVAMAPITVSILPAKAAAKDSDEDDEPAGFLGGLAGGWDAFTTALAAIATAAGAAAPFLLAFGLPLGAALWLLLRRRRKPAPVAEPSGS